MNLLETNSLTEEEAREYLEKVRWPDGVICPHCGNAEKCYVLKGKATRKGLYSCGACRKQFTVTVGTVMEDSHLSCRLWVSACHLMSSSKKGISALQIQRNLGLKSYRSAWFLAHRIRAAMEQMNMLGGTVEVDETFVGPKGGKGTKPGRGTKKTPVVAMVSREQGGVHTRVVDKVKGHTLKSAIREVVLPDSRIMTDENRCYAGLAGEYNAHETVNHSEKEYSRFGYIHINNAEAYFALLKRGVHGTFHHVSRRHLGRYCHEFSFRWSHRKINDGQRTRSAIALMDGKRLTYAKLIEKEPDGSGSFRNS